MFVLINQRILAGKPNWCEQPLDVPYYVEAPPVFNEPFYTPTPPKSEGTKILNLEWYPQ